MKVKTWWSTGILFLIINNVCVYSDIHGIINNYVQCNQPDTERYRFCMFILLLLKKICIFVGKADQIHGKVRQRSSICWFPLQMAPLAGAELLWSQEPGTFSRFPTRAEGSRTMCHSALPSQEAGWEMYQLVHNIAPAHGIPAATRWGLSHWVIIVLGPICSLSYTDVSKRAHNLEWGFLEARNGGTAEFEGD